MHLKRQKSTTKLPIPRKGTTFIARARSSQKNTVPVVIAIRDILKLARNSKEVKKMINEKKLKLNGKIIKDHKQSLSLFNLLEADKPYFLTLLPTKKFSLQLSKTPNTRLCKIISKKLIKKNHIQINCHDGTNLISKEKISVGDSVYLDLKGKIKKHMPLEKGSNAIVLSGKYSGLQGKINSIKEKGITIKINDKDKEANLTQKQVIVI